VLKGFKEFIAKGNAVDLAVGVVIGAAFGTVVNALVTGIINPLVGLVLPGDVKDLGAKVVTVSGADFAWGSVVSAAITFVITAFAVYLLIVMPMNAWRNRGDKPADEQSNEERMIELLEQIARK
jgi:large conductance mechanosensitive channel